MVQLQAMEKYIGLPVVPFSCNSLESILTFTASSDYIPEMTLICGFD